MNMAKILYIVVAIIVIQGILVFTVFKSKSKGGNEVVDDIKKYNIAELEVVSLGEVFVPLPVAKEGEEWTARVKVVIYITKDKGIEMKDFENKYRPKLREIIAKTVKRIPYIKLRNTIEEQESLKIVLRSAMNKEIGREIIKEVVFDGAIVFE